MYMTVMAAQPQHTVLYSYTHIKRLYLQEEKTDYAQFFSNFARTFVVKNGFVFAEGRKTAKVNPFFATNVRAKLLENDWNIQIHPFNMSMTI